MKKRQYTRDFKISVLHELESGRTMGEICREHSIHGSVVRRWRKQYNEDPQTAFSGSGNTSSLTAKIAERERLIGQLYVEIDILKKALYSLKTKLAEDRKYGGK